MPSGRAIRIAGFCYLLVIAGGIFAAVFVRESLFVADDPAATVHAIATHETLWRWGMAVHGLYLLAAVVFGVVLFRLFEPVAPVLSLMALVFAVGDIVVEAGLLTALWVPLLIDGDAAATALGEEFRDALAHLAVRLFLAGWGFGLLLFSGFCITIGALIWRSRFLPRVIGALMIAAGASYFVNSVVAIVSPPLSRALFPWILLPPLAGELSLALWLTVKGTKFPFRRTHEADCECSVRHHELGRTGLQ